MSASGQVCIEFSIEEPPYLEQRVDLLHVEVEQDLAVCVRWEPEHGGPAMGLVDAFCAESV